MNDKKKIDHIGKMLGDMAKNLCEAVEADSLVLICNKGKGTAVVVGGGEDIATEDMVKKFKENAERMVEMANGLEIGVIKCDGQMYVKDGDGETRKLDNANRDEPPPDICSLGL